MSSNSVLGSASQATINIFDSVSKTANAATKIISGVTTGANMFERLMDDMDENHKKRSILAQASYEEVLLETTAIENAKRQRTIQRELSEDSDLKQLFVEQHAKLNSLLNPVKPE